ncbi:hypothetical protein WICPIJ_004423 [Wickerhamomyces pijperi]|uniref:Uncharacterized protein n=1 Tax=Wickerhamomyces pijperi TaxID=599730 RepID=A0A9P8Q5Y9_WICPI|nr:hypothetical protein WICPIJ_004423 [Wickerhamomyces pijperi]
MRYSTILNVSELINGDSMEQQVDNSGAGRNNSSDSLGGTSVVINASLISKFSWSCLIKGARQLVVHEAFESKSKSLVTSSSLTPTTNIGTVLEGAVMITFLAPAFKCLEAVSTSLKTPVDSMTYSTPNSPHLISSGSLSLINLMEWPLTIKLSSS